ncbi:MAG: FKBP-type peptidyl-prolyl cis-trans isomerase [Candidatus Rokubacteria bacterium]|nr:FKBP-type peptidyl-prolyl cis-trans isomerase [Candidatus Rokubacteria bacterium]
MRTLVTCTFVLLLAGAALAADGPELKTEEDKTLYALGQALSRSLGSFSLTEAELAQVEAGLADGVLHRDSKVDMDTYGPKIKEMQQARLSAAAALEKKAGQAFLDKAAGETGSTKTDSGVIITPIKPGTGDAPKTTDKVKVHYTGTLTDGTVFDSSVQRGEPVTFGLNQVIPCWTEGLQHMKVGSKTRLVCPPSTAYGDRGAPPVIKPGATLVFEVELLEIVK